MAEKFTREIAFCRLKYFTVFLFLFSVGTFACFGNVVATFIQVTRVNSRNGSAIDDSTINIVLVINIITILITTIVVIEGDCLNQAEIT